ncbi:hypothetical protein V2J09_001809 [Rumex salicifolius]
MTRPNISYMVQHLSQFMAQPREPYYKATVHVVRYLKGSLDLGLFFSIADFCSLTRFCDANWVPLPIPLHCDNLAALHIAQNPVYYKRTKHLRLDCHYVRDKLQEGFIRPIHVKRPIFYQTFRRSSAPLFGWQAWSVVLTIRSSLRGGYGEI